MLSNRILFVLGIVFGLGVWIFAEVLTGSTEPWDAENGNYIFALVLGGLAYGFVAKSKPWLSYVSIYLGQFFYGFFPFMGCLTFMSCPGGANLFPLGAVIMIVTTIPAAVGAYVGYSLKQEINKKKDKAE